MKKQSGKDVKVITIVGSIAAAVLIISGGLALSEKIGINRTSQPSAEVSSAPVTENSGTEEAEPEVKPREISPERHAELVELYKKPSESEMEEEEYTVPIDEEWFKKRVIYLDEVQAEWVESKARFEELRDLIAYGSVHPDELEAKKLERDEAERVVTVTKEHLDKLVSEYNKAARFNKDKIPYKHPDYIYMTTGDVLKGIKSE